MLRRVIIAFQNWILSVSPALFPLLGIVYSLITSAHCSVMCSPLVPRETAKKREAYFVGRIVSYTSIGILSATFGSLLRQSLEFGAIAALAFFIYGFFTLIAFAPQILPHYRGFRFSGGRPFLRGLLSAAIPCHSLLFMYSLAAFSGRPWGGALLLFSHAVMTMPALAYTTRAIASLGRAGPWAPRVVKWMVLVLSLINLAYFGSRIIFPDEVARQKLFFCL